MRVALSLQKKSGSPGPALASPPLLCYQADLSFSLPDTDGPEDNGESGVSASSSEDTTVLPKALSTSP